MQVNAEESVENDNGKTRAHDNIRDGIPKMLDQSWGHRIMKKGLSRFGISHERRSTIVAPPAKTNRPMQKTAPIATRQQPVVRDTATTGIDHSVVPDPSAVQAGGASDGAPVQGSVNTTDAQAAGEPSLAPRAVSSNAEESAAPDAKCISATPREENLQRNEDHRPKQKQNVLNEPASREIGEIEREESAKKHVSQILEHHLSGHERAQIAILIDIEDYKGSRRVCVKCFDGAAKKANAIRTILSKHGASLQGFPYAVHHKGETKIFGYKGSDIESINDLSDSGRPPFRTHGYPTHPFSNTPYWTRDSTMVEIFRGDERDGNMIGAPIRMASPRWYGYSAVSMWTCGGIVKVDGTDYGLTTAHPLVLSNPENLPSDGAGMTMDLILDNGPFGGKDNFFSSDHHPERHWQAIGKVSHYALAKMGSIPSNNDWLLFELPKDRSIWNDFGNGAESSIHTLAVFTARGTLSAHILEGTAFLILGNSPFEVLKIRLWEPLRKDAYVQHHR